MTSTFLLNPICVAHAHALLQVVNVTINSPGGHSSMPPIDNSSISARLGAFLSALSGSPPAPKLESPTKEFVDGLLQLPGSWLGPLATLMKVHLEWPAVPHVFMQLQVADHRQARCLGGGPMPSCPVGPARALNKKNIV